MRRSSESDSASLPGSGEDGTPASGRAQRADALWPRKADWEILGGDVSSEAAGRDTDLGAVAAGSPTDSGKAARMGRADDGAGDNSETGLGWARDVAVPWEGFLWGPGRWVDEETERRVGAGEAEAGSRADGEEGEERHSSPRGASGGPASPASVALSPGEAPGPCVHRGRLGTNEFWQISF